MPGILILDELQSATEGGGIKLKDPLQTQDGTLLLSPSGEVSINFDNLANDSISGDKIHGGTISDSFLDGIKLNSSGNSITKSDGITSVLSESGGVVTLQNVTLGDSAVPSHSMNFRNRIINGDMRIDQRNAGASSLAANATYYLDRWVFLASQNNKFNIGRNLGSATPPTGFTNYLGLNVASAVSVASGDYFSVAQRIEGFNVADLGWGTANAKTVTLSFQVYSSLAGTFGGVFRNSSNARAYPFTYTISSANTWTSISVTVVGDVTGTWNTNSSSSIEIWWNLGAGSTFSTTAGAWAAGNFTAPTGATSVVGTSGATFYITGVQLEVGTVATPFEHRPYGTELALCQRYYEVGVVFGQYKSSDDTGGWAHYKVTKRVNPTIQIFPPDNSQSNYGYYYSTSSSDRGNRSINEINPTQWFAGQTDYTAGFFAIMGSFTPSSLNDATWVGNYRANAEIL